MADDGWMLRVKQSRKRSDTDEVVIVRGEWLDGQTHGVPNQSAEVLVGGTVKRIERVYDKDQRIRVPGEAVLHLYGIGVEEVPVGAIIRGPVA